ncbi:rCG23333, partial [Rattus norvegicus]
MEDVQLYMLQQETDLQQTTGA